MLVQSILGEQQIILLLPVVISRILHAIYSATEIFGRWKRTEIRMKKKKKMFVLAWRLICLTHTASFKSTEMLA
jgi:hypothetical protein